MQTFFIILLIVTAALMVVGFKNEEDVKGDPRLGRLLIAAGFGVLALAGLVVNGIDDQRGMFSIGIAGLLGAAYLVRAPVLLSKKLVGQDISAFGSGDDIRA